jgi:hypothetical protein
MEISVDHLHGSSETPFFAVHTATRYLRENTHMVFVRASTEADLSCPQHKTLLQVQERYNI